MKRFVIAAARRARQEAGFTLIEVVISAMLVAVLAGGVAEALIASSQTSADQRHRSQAAELAQQDQERLKGLSASQLNGLNQSRSVTVDGTPYTVTSTAQFLNTGGASSCGSSGTGAAAFYKTASTVTWASNKRPPVIAESTITPPAGGILLTQVLNQAQAGVAGVAVTASGPDYGSATTDSGGCAELADLAPGSYNVTLADPGYVDYNGDPSPITVPSVTVTATGTSSITPQPVMGLAGTINANFTTAATNGTVSCPAASGLCTNQQADSLSWFGSGSSSQMSAVQSYPSSGPLSSPAALIPSSGTIGLFPFYWTTTPSYASNYEVWAGKCQQMEPPAGTDKFSVSPGSNQTLPVQEPAMNVVVQNYNGSQYVRVAPAHVRIYFQSYSGPGCADNWYAPVASDAATDPNGSLAYPGLPFATAATSGSTASASGYISSYFICADYGGYNAYATWLENTNFSAPTPATVQIKPGSSGTSQGTC